MGLRETLNKRPDIAAGITAGIIAIAIFIVWSSQRKHEAVPAYRVFFTVDDGQTTFGGDLTMIPPFQHEGREAVRAYMYQGSDGKPFVGFLEKYTPEARQRLLDAKSADERSQAMEAIGGGGVLVKKPGAATWVRRSDPKSGAIMSVKDATGKDASPVRPTD